MHFTSEIWIDIVTGRQRCSQRQPTTPNGAKMCAHEWSRFRRFLNCGDVRCSGGERSIAAGRKMSTKDRKSTRLNSSHGYISYAVFCLKKKKKQDNSLTQSTHTCEHTDAAMS